MTSRDRTGLDRLVKALFYSLQGLRATFIHEPAFRQEIVLSLFLVPLGLWLGDTGAERALLTGSVVLVVVVELVNSAIENTVDCFGGENHELSCRAKDAGSAAVLVALLNVVLVWALVLFA